MVSQLLLAYNSLAHFKDRGADNHTGPGRHTPGLWVCGRLLEASGWAESSALLCTLEKFPHWLANQFPRLWLSAWQTIYLYCRWAVAIAHVHWPWTKHMHWRCLTQRDSHAIQIPEVNWVKTAVLTTLSLPASSSMSQTCVPLYVGAYTHIAFPMRHALWVPAVTFNVPMINYCITF